LDRGNRDRGGTGARSRAQLTVAVEFVEVAPGDERLPAVFEVMRQLRDQRTDDQLNELYATGYPDGYRVAGLFDDGECRAAAGYRVATNFVSGRHLYVDDLVTGERWRSHGYGRALNEYLAHFHAERPHQGKGNVILFPTENLPQTAGERIVSKHRLGGLLRYYCRAA